MIIQHLRIETFRGIRTLDWHLRGRVLCLIGPNDSTKTTILDAIELVLMPRFTAQITDADFYRCNPTTPIVIEATVGELPPELIVDPDKFGLCLRGYDTTTGILDDPTDDAVPVLTIRFEVGEDLEPEWTVVKQSLGEPRRIGWKDRERIGVTRLGDDVEKHLTWARGSALSKLTAKNTSTAQTFARATREAKKIVAESKMDELTVAAAAAKTAAGLYGAGFDELKPGLDLTGFFIGASVLGLHENAVPVRLWGLGTKRLAALAIQQCGVGQSSILLVDELEHGLEPHRVRLLLDRLKGAPDGSARKEGQVIFTTHSPTAAMALPVELLRFVRSHDGVIKVEKVQQDRIDDLQKVARTHAHAFLGRKLLVCEGATEVGLCRGMAPIWAKAHDDLHLAVAGGVILDGKGCTVAPGVALELKRVGYDVAVLGDSDAAMKPAPAELTKQGVTVIQWDGDVCTEQRIATDLPLDALQKVLDAAIRHYGEMSIRDQLAHHGSITVAHASDKLSTWITPTVPEAIVRTAIGMTANKREWFKDITRGTELGTIVASVVETIPDTPLAKRLGEVAAWIYAGRSCERTGQ